MYNSIKKNGAISDMQITTWSLDRQAEYFRGEVIINCLLSNIPSITTFVQMYSNRRIFESIFAQILEKEPS
ncbi:unnamed protein product [Rhizophagus irregularis]|nr:unnamed protein product [Rhizophagus irregularis]